jgi:hypothetical protein
MDQSQEVDVEVQRAIAKEHRMKAWEHQMRGFKELCIGLLVVLCGVVVYSFTMRIWHLLPK